jgi:polysaccharide biosynthesis transport protein
MREITDWRVRPRFSEGEDIEPEYTPVPPSDGVNLSDYWNILVKRRRTIILLFLAVFAIGAYFPLSATKLYTASATIKIEPQNPQVTGVGALQPEGGGVQFGGTYDYYQTQFALLKSRPLAARVIADLSLESNKIVTSHNIITPNPLDHLKSSMFRIVGYLSYYLTPLFQSGVRTDEAERSEAITIGGNDENKLNVAPHIIHRYLSFLEITPVQKTRLVRVQFTTPDPALSQALANAHVQSFLRMSLESRFSLTKEAREFLDQKKNELRQKLERSEAALNDFRRAHGVVSVEKGENIVVDRLVELNRQLTAARAQRLEAESLYRTVENKNYQDLAEITKQGLVQQLKGNVATLEAEKARLSTIFKPDHPRIQELTQQITAGRQAWSKEIANVVSGIQSSYVAAQAKEKALENEADKQQQGALKLKELGVNYAVLQEEVNANRSLYENVLKRLSETNVSNDIAVSNMQMAEGADRPLAPSSPNVPLYLVASIVSGLFFGVGIAFLQEFFSSVVATPDDVTRSVGLSTFGVVPHLRFLTPGTHGDGQTGRIHSRPGKSAPRADGRALAKEVMINSPLSIISESYRTIRASLLLSQADKPPQVILLTSPSPGEGKTVTTVNLGVALAHDGYSVLVVDGDMRKGCCHARLGLKNNRGLSNVLTGRLSLAEGIQATGVSGLSLLSRGILPPNPNELLGSQKMRQILEELRQTFKFILIDSPPANALSDAAVLSVLSDGVLLVLNGQTTLTPSAQRTVQRLDMVRAHLLGAILNGVNLDDPHYAYYRTYSSYYGDNSSNADDQIGVNGNGSHNPSKLRKIARSWSKKNSAHRTAGPSEGENVKEDRANTVENVAAVGYPAEIMTEKLERSEIGRVKGLKELSPDGNNKQASESQDSLNRLVEALSKAIGPIAPEIVREQIAVLGEPRYAFPGNRIDELLKLIQRAITEDELKLFSSHYFGKDLRS